ncbi:IS1182 family transposase [Prevotella merdae]|uniref:IS1182 family transposase n=1 Tax=Prevotella merdae TaxID=2079531 RepID=UPI000D0E4193|nr:IS1182 family transposase [Prevotella merdae]
MLSQQQLPLSEYSSLYDIVDPRDSDIRRINNLIDFSCVYQELVKKYCPDNGRTAESPIRMFKYLLLKTIYDISDVDVVERSRYDMSFKYFLDMTPEEGVINPSSLCKFRRLRLKDTDLMNLLIKKTVEIAIEKGIITSKTIIVDSTHTKARSNPYSPVEILKLRSKQLRKALYAMDDNIKETLPAKNEDDDLVHELDYTKDLLNHITSDSCLSEVPAVKQRLNMLKETLADIEDHYTTSKDTDARVGHKTEDTSFFGYKTHIAMSDERIITAATVTSGEKGDGPQLEELVEQSRKNGMEVDTVVGDTAYSGCKNLKLAEDEERGFRLVSKLHPSISSGFRKSEDNFDYNKDAGMFVCPAGHMAIRKVIMGKNRNWNQSMTYFFDVDKCKTCSRRNGCYKDGAKSKTYSVPIKKGEHKRQLEFQKTQEFKEIARQRYKIEAKNSELKQVYGYDKALSYGLDCMQMQGAMTIFAVNIKRILRLS